MKRISLLIVLSILKIFVFGQKVSTLGIPNTQNYTKSQYKAGNQNWSIAQGKDGIIYAGNTEGLLVFDGAYWELYPLDNHELVRSVSIAPNGDIYVGGKEEFGYFTKKQGKLIYHNLSKLVKPSFLENDEIWKIIFTDSAVIFQSFSKFYLYKNNKIDLHFSQGEAFLFMHQIASDIWIEKIPSGLQKWNGSSFLPLAKKINNVLTLLPFTADNILIGTAKQGLYLLSTSGTIQKWEPNKTLEKKLQEAQINNGLKISDGIFALGTIKDGIFIIDKQGNILQHIHTRNGLQNNTVLSMTLDQQGNIWAGLDNGIARIEINSPFYYYKNNTGELGAVYAIKIYDNNIYLGTNQGLFYSPWTEDADRNNLDMHFIPGSQGQVWNLDIFNGQLICGHNDGTFLVSGSQFKRISPWTGGWINKQITPTSKIFIQGNYTGLATFEDQGYWHLKQKLQAPKKVVFDLAKIDSLHFWIVLNNTIELIQFDVNYTQVKVVKTFSFKADFPNIKRIKISTLQGNNIFISDKGIFLYDNVLSTFKPYTDLNKKLGSFARARQIKRIEKNKYILSYQGRFAEVKFDKQLIHIDSTSFNSLEDIVLKNHEVIEAYTDKLLIGLDNGIAIYDPTNYKPTQILQPLIMGFKLLGSNKDSIASIIPGTPIPNNKNTIRILFSSPWYSNSPLEYQYILVNNQNQWSVPSTTPFIDFNNLNWGHYTFKVRAISTTGQISAVTSIQFSILPPWYLTWKAWLIYICLVLIIFIITRKLIIKKLALDKSRIRKELTDRQQELLRKETAQNEKKLMTLRNNQLHQELELKNRELANAATNIQYKNELLNNLNEELLKVKDKDGQKLSQDQLQKVNTLISNARNDERDWDLFEKSFNESHENFFKKLKVDYPTLSPNDVKLCAYLRLNMSSKDIASLINISIRGVEIRRYRLRKKFNLPTDKNLNEFLIEL